MSGKKCLLNNMRMHNYRKSMEYQAVMIDLAINGIVDKEKVEEMLGYEIPDYIRPARKEQVMVGSSGSSRRTVAEDDD